MYETLDQVSDEIEEIKRDYISSNKGPKFPGYQIILAEVKSELMARASDYFCISFN